MNWKFYLLLVGGQSVGPPCISPLLSPFLRVRGGRVAGCPLCVHGERLPARAPLQVLSAAGHSAHFLLVRPLLSLPRFGAAPELDRHCERSINSLAVLDIRVRHVPGMAPYPRN